MFIQAATSAVPSTVLHALRRLAPTFISLLALLADNLSPLHREGRGVSEWVGAVTVDARSQ